MLCAICSDPAGTGEAAARVEYHGYRITPAPQRQASGWNTAGVIAKTFDDGVKEHRFIRVDTHAKPGRRRRLLDHQGAADHRRAGRSHLPQLVSARADNLLPCDGIVRLHEDALAEADARRLFDELMAVTPWRQEIATVMGRRVPIPTLTAWHGEVGYVYSGIRMSAGALERTAARDQGGRRGARGSGVQQRAAQPVSDGRDSVSGTPTTSLGLGRDPVIASVSLGATRRFQMKHRKRDNALASICRTARAWSWPGPRSITGCIRCRRPAARSARGST